MEFFVNIFDSSHSSTINTRSSILGVAGIVGPTLITYIFTSQSWILINLQPVFPSCWDWSINFNSKKHAWLLWDGDILMLKSNSHLPKTFVLFPLMKVLSDLMKIASIISFKKFIWFSRYLIFCLQFCSCRKKVLIRNKIFDVTTWLTSNGNISWSPICNKPNISRSKGNKTMKFGQFIELKKWNIFLQKSCRKWGSKTSSRPIFIF